MKITTLSLCSFGLLTAIALPTNPGISASGPAGAPDPEEPQGAPQAVVLGDYDADGSSDIYAVNPYGEDRLYRNAGDGSFVDVTTETGLAGLSGTRQVLFADCDGDGLSDLLIVSAQGTRLFRNIGETFVDDTERAGLSTAGVATDAQWEDIERDGVLDLVLRNRAGVKLYRGLGDATFEQLDVRVSRAALNQQGEGAPAGGGPAGAPGAPFAPAAFGAPGAPGAPGRAPTGGTPGSRPTGNAGGNGPGGTPAIAGPGWSATGAGPNLPSGPPALSCAGSVEDQANPGTGFCIPASTTPTDGLLYPLGEDFFIDDVTGKVGMGTVSPGMDLHIVGETTALGTLMIAPNDVVDGSNSELWLAEDHNGTYRMGFRYDGSTNYLKLMATDDGGVTEMGPWLTVERDTGAMAIEGVLDVDTMLSSNGNVNVDDHLFVQTDDPGGIFGTTMFVLNESAGSGTALWAASDGDGGIPTVYISQAGTGPIIATTSDFVVNSDGSTVAATLDLTGTGDARDLKVGNYLDVYSGGVDTVTPPTHSSIRGSSSNLIVNAKESGNLYLNYDSGDNVYVGVNGTTESTTLLDVNGRIEAVNDNSGVSGAAVRAENLDDSGIALYGRTHGSDATVVLSQQGSGDIVKGFSANANSGSTAIFRVTNTGRTVTSAVQITGGGDIVEGFESSEGKLEPGTVVVIDSENPGQLKVSSATYDRKVAGVVSGAGGVDHGIRMGQDGVLDGENLVAMTGRVYVKCTAENDAIQAGDLLTTSGVRGHAMRADDHERSFGSVIGKAMTSLDEGTGLVLVLVNLQ